MAREPKKRRPDDGVAEIKSTAFLEANATAHSRYGRFNLAIVGGTGVGKSSLVNAIFGRDEAAVGKGMPVTRGVHYYHDRSLGIWDFEGFEIGSERTPATVMRQNLQLVAARPQNEQISVVWYCVLSHADRLTQADIDMITELDRAGLPVILVLTKVDWIKNPIGGKRKAPKDTEEFHAWLEDPHDASGMPLTIPVQSVVLTSTRTRQGKGTGHGLGELLTETLALSPDDEKDAFRIAQRLNLPWKREMARRIIRGASAAAAGAAAVPIPVADAATLAPIQLAMMGRIAVIYDLELKTMMPATAVAQLGVQIAGQALARSFIKLIPGAGSAVNAGVAAALTAASGEAWIRLCEKVHTGDVNVKQVTDIWEEYSPTVISALKNLLGQRAVRR